MKRLAIVLVVTVWAGACSAPEQSRALLEEANRLYLANKKEEAEAKYREAVKADSKNLRAALMLGKLLALARKGSEAAEVLEDALDRHPACLECRYWLALSRSYDQASRSEALKVLDECLQNDSQSISAWILRGQIQELMGDSPGAVVSYGEARRLGADLATVEKRLAVLYKQAGLDKKAQDAEARAKILSGN